MEMVDETDTSEREDEEEIALDTPLENSKLSVFILLEEIFKVTKSLL